VPKPAKVLPFGYQMRNAGLSEPLVGKSPPHRWIPMESEEAKAPTSRLLHGRGLSPDSMGECVSPYINDVDGGPGPTRFFFGETDSPDGRGRSGQSEGAPGSSRASLGAELKDRPFPG
jgi:hypothetical protein